MPTTEPVFGWTVPADTDPLADGASAMRTLAGGISATLRSPAWAQLRSAADQTLSADGWSQAVLGAETDPGNIAAGNAITLPYAGLVAVTWGLTVGLTGTFTAVNISSALYVNGAEVQRGSSFASSSQPAMQSAGTVGSALLNATAGMVLTLWGFVQVPGATKKFLQSGTRLECIFHSERPAP